MVAPTRTFQNKGYILGIVLVYNFAFHQRKNKVRTKQNKAALLRVQNHPLQVKVTINVYKVDKKSTITRVQSYK